MTVKLAKERVIRDIWHQFNYAYPYLRVDFYRHVEGRLGAEVRQKLQRSVSLFAAGIRRDGDIEISESMTVRELEQRFLAEFGLRVQVSRKSGRMWLETTISDNWTLKQQNDHGRELSEPVKNDSFRNYTDTN